MLCGQTELIDQNKKENLITTTATTTTSINSKTNKSKDISPPTSTTTSSSSSTLSLSNDNKLSLTTNQITKMPELQQQQQQQHQQQSQYQQKQDNNNNQDTLATNNNFTTTTTTTTTTTIQNTINRDRLNEEKKIQALKERIKLLNEFIFRDPNNHQRPPSEYLEAFESLTTQLHISQRRLEDYYICESHNNDNNYNNNNNSSSNSNSASNSTVTTPTSTIPNFKTLNSINPNLSNSNSSTNINHTTRNTTNNNNNNNSSSYNISSNNSNNNNLNESNNEYVNNNNNNNNINSYNNHSNINSIDSRQFINISNSSTDNDYIQLIQQSSSSSSTNSPIMRRNRTSSSQIPNSSIDSINTNISINALTSTISLNNNNLIRIYTQNSTAVVKKENLTLKDLVVKRFKSRITIDFDKNIAYDKENNMKIPWDTNIMNSNANHIVIAPLGEAILHNFEKNTITFRLCDSCKRRNILHAYTCTKCEFTMCSKDECRKKSELCICNKSINSAKSDDQIKNPNELTARGDTSQNNFSQQILPVNLLTVNTSIHRDRSRSEIELTSLVDIKVQANSQKLTQQKSQIFGTMPRPKPPNPAKPLPFGQKNGLGPNRRDSLNTWEMPYNQIKLGPKVGSGSFGTVHMATDTYHDKVAIKFLNVQNPSPTQYDAFRNEVAILKTTRHDNVLLFIGCISEPYLIIVTEWCEGSSLYRHLHVEEEDWDMYQLIDIAKQTSTGMEYLHARDILHRDLKSNNIFLVPDDESMHRSHHRHHHTNNTSNNNNKLERKADKSVNKWTVKIGDFGLATVKSTWTKSANKANNPTGSILWMAPEVITQKVSDPYTQKSDIYSFGVVLYELVTGKLPYAQKEQDTILFLVGFGRLRPNPEDSRKDTPTEIKNLITKCCEYDRNKRPLFVELNAILKNVKISRLQRSQSTPNFNLNYDRLTSGAILMPDDDIYPTTPLLESNLTSNFTTNL